MNKLLVALGALAALSGCAMTPQQAQAWSEAAGQLSNNMARQQAQYSAQAVQSRPLTCWNYGRFTKCE